MRKVESNLIGPFYLAETELELQEAVQIRGISRGQVYAKGELDLLLKARPNGEQLKKIHEVKLLFNGVIIGKEE